MATLCRCGPSARGVGSLPGGDGQTSGAGRDRQPGRAARPVPGAVARPAAIRQRQPGRIGAGTISRVRSGGRPGVAQAARDAAHRRGHLAPATGQEYGLSGGQGYGDAAQGAVEGDSRGAGATRWSRAIARGRQHSPGDQYRQRILAGAGTPVPVAAATGSPVAAGLPTGGSGGSQPGRAVRPAGTGG